MVQDDGPVGLDGVQVKFDDERVVSDAGLMLVAMLAARLGVEESAQRFVRLRPKRPGAGCATTRSRRASPARSGSATSPTDRPDGPR